MTLILAQFCDEPKKISTKSSYPQKIFMFLKTPQNIEIQNFEPQKIAPAYVCVKISEYPPPPWESQLPDFRPVQTLRHKSKASGTQHPTMSNTEVFVAAFVHLFVFV